MIEKTPLIPLDQYPEFQRLIRGLPETHEQYLHRRLNQLYLDASTWESGREVIDVIVRAADFQKWCEAGKHKYPNMTLLHNFACEIA